VNSYGRWFSGVVCAGALVLGACGGSSDFSSAVPPKATLARVLNATSAAKTARVSMRVSVVGGPTASAGAFDLDATGAIDMQRQDSELTTRATVAGRSVAIPERVVDGVVYMQLPAGIPGITKPWVSVDTRNGFGASAQGFGQSQSDPTKFLSALAGVSDDVAEVGHEPVRGVDTTHYRATVDMGKALASPNVPAGLRDRLKTLAPQFGNAKLPVEVWVDSDGRARKELVTVKIADLVGAAASAAGDTAVQVELELWDFGTAVSIAAPPADQVQSLSSALHG